MFLSFSLTPERHKKRALHLAEALGDELSETVNALLTDIFSNQVCFFLLFFLLTASFLHILSETT
jgi:hypothetical protein